MLSRPEQARGEAAGDEDRQNRQAVPERGTEQIEQPRRDEKDTGADRERAEGCEAGLVRDHPLQGELLPRGRKGGEALRRRGGGGERHERDELLDAGRREVEPDGGRGRHQAQDDHVDDAEGRSGEVAGRDRQAGPHPNTPAVTARSGRDRSAHAHSQADTLGDQGEAGGAREAGHGDRGLGRGAGSHRDHHRGHHEPLAQEVGGGNREHGPVLATGNALAIILEGEEREDKGGGQDRRCVGTREQRPVDRDGGETDPGEHQATRRRQDGSAPDEPAHRAEVAAGLIRRDEAAGTLRKAEGCGMPEDRDPHRDRRVDAVFGIAHQPGHQDLCEVSETSRCDPDREDGERGAGRLSAERSGGFGGGVSRLPGPADTYEGLHRDRSGYCRNRHEASGHSPPGRSRCRRGV